MNDDVKAAVEWLRECVRVVTRNGVPEEADLEAAVLAHLDGEDARTAAAVAAAREEQREADAKFCPNCLGVGFVERPVPCPYCDDSTHDHYCPTGTQRQQCGCGAERIRATPLTSTPLADRIAELENYFAHARDCLDELADDVLVWRLESAALRTQKEQAELALEKAEAERDALFVSHANLAAVLADINEAVGGAAGEEPSLVRAVRTLVDERDALRAQVEAARALAKSEARPRAGGASVTSEAARDMRRRLAKDILAAMDGAKPK